MALLVAVFVAGAGVRAALAPLFAHDPTGPGSTQIDFRRVYYPFDIVWILWGKELVGQEGGVYGTANCWGLHYSYGPAMAYLSWLWAKAFGSSVLAMKFLFVAGDFAAMALVYLILRRLRGPYAGLVGVALYAFCGAALLVGSVLAKEDVLAAATILLTVWLVVRGGRADLVAAGATAAISFAIKPAIAFAAVPLGIYVVQRKGVRGLIAFTAVAAVAGIGLWGVEWARSGTLAYVHIGEQLRPIHGQSLFALPSRVVAAAAAVPGKAFFAKLDAFFRAYPVDMVVLAGLYVVFLWALWRRNRTAPEMLLLKSCAAGLILASVVKDTVYVQYHAWGVPFVIALAAVEWAGAGRPLRWGRILAGAALVTASLVWFSLFLWLGPLGGGWPDFRNLAFLAAALAGMVLLVPGWWGRGLGFVLAGALLFHIEFSAWSDRLLGVAPVRFSEAINWSLSVLLCYGGSLVLVLGSLRRSAELAPTR